jgi:hypothetical protein
MAVELAKYQANAQVITWDPTLVHGEVVEIWADNPADDSPLEFKKKGLNVDRGDGKAEGSLSFPEGYSGECNVEIRGEGDAVDSGSLTIG